MQLQRSSDLEGSETIVFTYQPEDPGKKHEHGINMGESFQDYSWIQDFEADFPQKVRLKMLN